MIEPTAGRIVWFYPEGSQPGSKPLAAVIAAVHNTRLVNLAVFASDGTTYGHRHTQLLQDNDAPPMLGADLYAAHCFWMPYQLGQAAKTEAAEKAAMKG